MKYQDFKNYAVIDVGGTNTRFALFNKNGEIIHKIKTKTNYTNAFETSDWIIEQINKNNINYLALCIPGPMIMKMELFLIVQT